MPVPDFKQYTYPQLLKINCEKYGDRGVALRKKRYGLWNSYTWKDYYDSVKRLSLGLISLGLECGDNVAIIGDNDPEWWYAELAAQAVGGVALGIYIDCMPAEIQYIVEHSDSTFVFAKDQEQVDKLLEIKSEIPKVKKVIYWDPKGMWAYDDPILMDFSQVLELGAEYEKAHSGLFEQNVSKGVAEDIGVICYTSGTTGLPKATMLSYRTLLEWVVAFWEIHPWYDGDEYLSFLCPAWATDQMLGFGAVLANSSVVNFPEEPETVRENTREISPQCVFSGARLFEELYRELQAKISDTWVVKRFFYQLLLPIGYRMAHFNYSGQQPSRFWRFLFKVADMLMFHPIRDRFGLARTRLCMVAGSMLSPEMFEYFQCLGVPLYTYYGLTECGSVTMECPGVMKMGSVGKKLGERQMEISKDGEILIKQDEFSFSGYYKDEEATQKAIIDGWYHTGDGGYFDEDEFFYFIGRLVDLRSLSSGERYSPEYIESKLRFSTYIKDSIAVGEDQQFISAIIIVDLTNVGRWAERNHISYTTYADLSQKPEVCQLIRREIQQINRTLPAYSQVKKFVNLHKELDPDEAELTRTRKLRRSLVEEKFGDIVSGLYDDNIRDIKVETEVRYRDGRKGITSTTIHITSVEEGATL